MSRISTRTLSICALLLVLLLAPGCAPTEIDAVYGRRRGTPGADSVNGTAVLANMFEQGGHRVTTWRRLSPKLREAKTIVWVPDSFAPPSEDQRRFLEQWLEKGSGHTLVYVGRDYDAAQDYWRKIQPLTPATQAPEVARRLALAQAIHDRRRAAMPKGESCDWFVLQRDQPHLVPQTLSGAWAEGIDAKKTAIELAGRLEVPSSAEINRWTERTYSADERPVYERLLASQRETIVGRISWESRDNQLLFVTNGSFLLNLPLVNHEHRKLAQRLVQACGVPGRTIFLESDEKGPEIYETEPGVNAPTGFEAFTVWPIGIILVHLTALGILACIVLLPIFGRPRALPARTTADFGKHIEALGELLEETGDRETALQQVRFYQEHVRRESGSKGAVKSGAIRTGN